MAEQESQYRVEMVFCEETILHEIAQDEMTPQDVSQTYHLILKSSEARTVDWGKINKAIIDRWGTGTLVKIKTDAWSGECFD